MAGAVRLLYPKDVVTYQNILLPIITHTGDSTDTSGLSAEGIAERVLLILAEVLLVVVGVLSFIILATWFCDLGKHILV